MGGKNLTKIGRAEKIAILICLIILIYFSLSYFDVVLHNLGGHNYGTWNIFNILWERG